METTEKKPCRACATMPTIFQQEAFGEDLYMCPNTNCASFNNRVTKTEWSNTRKYHDLSLYKPSVFLWVLIALIVAICLTIFIATAHGEIYDKSENRSLHRLSQQSQ